MIVSEWCSLGSLVNTSLVKVFLHFSEYYHLVSTKSNSSTPQWFVSPSKQNSENPPVIGIFVVVNLLRHVLVRILMTEHFQVSYWSEQSRLQSQVKRFLKICKHEREIEAAGLRFLNDVAEAENLSLGWSFVFKSILIVPEAAQHTGIRRSKSFYFIIWQQ